LLANKELARLKKLLSVAPAASSQRAMTRQAAKTLCPKNKDIIICLRRFSAIRPSSVFCLFACGLPIYVFPLR